MNMNICKLCETRFESFVPEGADPICIRCISGPDGRQERYLTTTKDGREIGALWCYISDHFSDVATIEFVKRAPDEWDVVLVSDEPFYERMCSFVDGYKYANAPKKL
jgi:hypothetical protein